MTAVLPVVFLDVDGTIATFIDSACDFSDPRVAWTVDPAAGIRYNPDVVGWIHEISALAEVRWLTSWVHTARTHLAPALGLPDFPALPFGEHRYKDLDWKHSAVLAQLTDEPGRPVLWIDDELHYREAYDGLMSYVMENGLRFYAVQPTLSDGITEAHMLRIRTFLTRM